MSLRHPVSISCYALQHDAVSHIVLLCVATERCNTTHSCETLHHICGAPLYWYEWVICHICARVVHLSSTYVTYNSFISMEWCTTDMTQKSGAPQIWPNRVVHHIYDTDSIQWSTTLAFRGAPQIWHSSIPWCTTLAIEWCTTDMTHSYMCLAAIAARCYENDMWSYKNCIRHCWLRRWPKTSKKERKMSLFIRLQYIWVIAISTAHTQGVAHFKIP